jgi:PPOX class probable F420-dependent enzyme
MQRAEALAFLEVSRVGHLGTVRPEGTPHVVPVTFALVGEAVVTMVDHKPKTTTRLQRLTNVEANPTATLLVDEWFEDWDRLRWVRVDGAATTHRDGDIWSESRAALAAKYAQYADRPPESTAIVISIDRVTGWSSSG